MESATWWPTMWRILGTLLVLLVTNGIVVGVLENIHNDQYLNSNTRVRAGRYSRVALGMLIGNGIMILVWLIVAIWTAVF